MFGEPTIVVPAVLTKMMAMFGTIPTDVLPGNPSMQFYNIYAANRS